MWQEFLFLEEGDSTIDMEPPSEIIIEFTLKHLHDSLVENLVENFRLFSHACGCISRMAKDACAILQPALAHTITTFFLCLNVMRTFSTFGLYTPQFGVPLHKCKVSII